MRTLAEGALQRVRSCCGHTSGDHVVRFTDPAKGSGATHYCNACRATCTGPATVTRSAMTGSPWGLLTPFVKPASADSAGPRRFVLSGEPMAVPTTTRRSPFDDLIAGLQRDAATAEVQRRPSPLHRSSPTIRPGAFDRLADDLRRDAARMAAPEPDPHDVVVMFEEDEHRNMRAVRKRAPRSRLERLTDELLAESKPPAKQMTREEARAKTVELDRRHEQRLHQRRLAEIRAAARQVGEFRALAGDLEAACRR